MFTQEGEMIVPGVLSRNVELKSGHLARYATAGENGPSVVLLHGGIIGSSGLAGWRLMIPFLAEQGFRVYAPDRPGFGLADVRDGRRLTNGIHDQVRFIHEFVEAVGLEDQFCITGNSMGATMAAAYAVNYPHRIKNMVLIASASMYQRLGTPEGTPRPNKARQGSGLGPFDGTNAWMRKTMEGIIYAPENIPEDLVTMRTQMGIRDQVAFAEMNAGYNAEITDMNRFQEVNFKGRLDKLTIPTIFVWGKDDVLAPVELGYEMEKELPNIKFYYPGYCGHQAQTDRPDLLNNMTLEWFRDARLKPETLAKLDQREPANAEAAAPVM